MTDERIHPGPEPVSPESVERERFQMAIERERLRMAVELDRLRAAAVERDRTQAAGKPDEDGLRAAVEWDEDLYRAAVEQDEVLYRVAVKRDENRFQAAAHTRDDARFEQMVIAFALGNFTTAFVQALGQRAADGAAKRVAHLVRTRFRRKGECLIGVDDGSAATIAITEDTPDEARLALLDLDVTADELRGKTLRWDSSASAWRPDDDQEARPAGR